MGKEDKKNDRKSLGNNDDEFGEARSGREKVFQDISKFNLQKQRYSPEGSRLVVGTLPIDRSLEKIMMVASRNTPGTFSLPKGGWENDETQEEAAVRETWEEGTLKSHSLTFYIAGLRGKIKRKLGPFYHTKTLPSGHPTAEYYFYEMDVEHIEDKFPEAKERERRWFTIEEALRAETKHPTMHVLLSCSLHESLRRNGSAGRATRSASQSNSPAYTTRSTSHVTFDSSPPQITIYDDSKKKKDKKK